MTPPEQVLYVYRCTTCGHAGEVHLDDDSHEGEQAHCDSCGAPVTLEWTVACTSQGAEGGRTETS